MRLKSYFAGTVEAAIALAARELGDDALLVYSREAAPEARYLGRYEVVFGLPETGAPSTGGAHPANSPPAPGAERGDLASGPVVDPASRPVVDPASREVVDPALRQVVNEVQALRAQLDRLAGQVGTARVAAFPILAGDPHRAAAPDRSPESFPGCLERALLAAEVPGPLAAGVADAWASQAAGLDRSGYPGALRGLLEQMLPVDASLEAPGDGCRVVMAVGPPGAGKTTALVKLAARFGVAARRPSLLISFDPVRIAGAEQLRTYAAILGIGFHAVETGRALAQALEAHRHYSLVLIDTAGIGAHDQEEAEELTRLLEAHRDIDVHLTLSASMKPADLTRVADRFARFRPNKLLFTRLDETSTFGPLWAEAVARALPVSFLSDGQRVPEDLREATRESIVALVLGTALQTWTASAGPESARDDYRHTEAVPPAGTAPALPASGGPAAIAA